MKDFLQLFKILTYDIWLYKKSEKKNMAQGVLENCGIS